MNVQKNNFGFHSNRKTQGQKHQVNNLYFKYQVCQIKLRHLNTFLQFRLLFHEPHCTCLVEQPHVHIPVFFPIERSSFHWSEGTGRILCGAGRASRRRRREFSGDLIDSISILR